MGIGSPEEGMSKDEREADRRLRRSAFAGYAEDVRAALMEGANPDAKRGSNGMTALMHAANKGFEEIARLLLAAGAKVGETDGNGWTALHYAAPKGEVSVARLLLEAGADPNEKDMDGYTPLLLAAQIGSEEAIVRALLAAGADIDERDKRGWAALHWAGARDYVVLLRILLDAGANMGARSLKGETAEGLAENYAGNMCAEILKTRRRAKEENDGLEKVAMAKEKKRNLKGI